MSCEKAFELAAKAIPCVVQVTAALLFFSLLGHFIINAGARESLLVTLRPKGELMENVRSGKIQILGQIYVETSFTRVNVPYKIQFSYLYWLNRQFFRVS